MKRWITILLLTVGAGFSIVLNRICYSLLEWLTMLNDTLFEVWAFLSQLIFFSALIIAVFLIYKKNVKKMRVSKIIFWCFFGGLLSSLTTFFLQIILPIRVDLIGQAVAWTLSTTIVCSVLLGENKFHESLIYIIKDKWFVISVCIMFSVGMILCYGRILPPGDGISFLDLENTSVLNYLFLFDDQNFNHLITTWTVPLWLYSIILSITLVSYKKWTVISCRSISE